MLEFTIKRILMRMNERKLAKKIQAINILKRRESGIPISWATAQNTLSINYRSHVFKKRGSGTPILYNYLMHQNFRRKFY